MLTIIVVQSDALAQEKYVPFQQLLEKLLTLITAFVELLDLVTLALYLYRGEYLLRWSLCEIHQPDCLTKCHNDNSATGTSISFRDTLSVIKATHIA